MLKILFMLSAAVCLKGAAIYSAGPFDTFSTNLQDGVEVISWTQTSAYTNVAVSVNLTCLNRGDVCVFATFLTNSIGPGTTEANQLGAYFSAYLLGYSGNAPVISYATWPLFSGLSLPPGTYYLTVRSFGGGWWRYSHNQNPELGPGVTAGPNYIGGASAAYTPASALAVDLVRRSFSITGDLVVAPAVPEPRSAVLVAGAIAALLYLRRGKRSAAIQAQ